eukprot:scaffold135879_cov49-Prasinocladus_malaysianus.AAC.1
MGGQVGRGHQPDAAQQGPGPERDCLGDQSLSVVEKICGRGSRRLRGILSLLITCQSNLVHPDSSPFGRLSVGCQAKDMMRAEAKDLASASFGPRLLHTIGTMYKMQVLVPVGKQTIDCYSWAHFRGRAEIFLGNLWTSTISAVALQFHSMSGQLDAAKAAILVGKWPLNSHGYLRFRR